MATAKKADKQGGEIQIVEIQRGRLDVCIIGTTPLILNRMSRKAWQELLAPKTKTAADRAGTVKHDPIKEFRSSPYIIQDSRCPTYLGFMPSAFKKSMGTAALDTPGAKKAQIGRLVTIPGEMIPVFGIPQLFMSIVRSADTNKTPDVRTRAILPEWACRVTIMHAQPILRSASISALLAIAGFQSGIGDWRQEKGSGSYGSFRCVEEDDKDFVRICKAQGREAQKAALRNPVAYNDETREMLEWFGVEMRARGWTFEANGEVGKAPQAPEPKRKRSAAPKTNGAGESVGAVQ